METIIRLIFLLFVLLWTIECFFPGWRVSPPAWAFGFSIGVLVRWLIGLLVLYIIYLIVLAILGLFVGLPGF